MAFRVEGLGLSGFRVIRNIGVVKVIGVFLFEKGD